MAKEKGKREAIDKEVEKEAKVEIKTNDIGEKFISEPLTPKRQE